MLAGFTVGFRVSGLGGLGSECLGRTLPQLGVEPAKSHPNSKTSQPKSDSSARAHD